MHDPQTVAHEIRYPWRAYRRTEARNDFEREYRQAFVTIWHVDPERDGSDDSCGYSYPRLTKQQLERLKNLAWNEGHDPYFLRQECKHWKGSRAEAEALYRGLVLAVAWQLDLSLSFDKAATMAARRIHRPDCVDAANAFCFLPGWHTNSTKDTPDRRQDVFLGTAIGIARDLLRERRRWYQHPRWHVWHWKLQVHPTQAFKRWAFSRCAGCGKRFAWGESPCSHQWGNDGPRWFRGERGVYHMNCSGSKVAPTSDEAQSVGVARS
jgi:hypothetical protein